MSSSVRDYLLLDYCDFFMQPGGPSRQQNAITFQSRNQNSPVDLLHVFVVEREREMETQVSKMTQRNDIVIGSRTHTSTAPASANPD